MWTYEQVVNEVNLKIDWFDLSNEKWREYVFPNNVAIKITAPIALGLSPRLGSAPEYGGNSHRIIDANGFSHYIPRGWLLLTWEGKEGPAYDF